MSSECTYCGRKEEVKTIRIVQWTSGHVDREECIRCATCGNVKYGNIKPIGKKVEL